MNKDAIEYHVRGILEAIGEDPEREGLKETPQRVAGIRGNRGRHSSNISNWHYSDQDVFR